jgi:hypothetical protein
MELIYKPLLFEAVIDDLSANKGGIVLEHIHYPFERHVVMHGGV